MPAPRSLEAPALESTLEAFYIPSVTFLETLGSPLPIHEALVIAKFKTMGISSKDLENPEEMLNHDLVHEISQ